MLYESIDQGNDVKCLVVPGVLFLFFRKKILDILIWQFFLAYDILLYELHGFVSDENLYISPKATRFSYQRTRNSSLQNCY